VPLVERGQDEVEELAQAVGHGRPILADGGLIVFDVLVDRAPPAADALPMPSFSEFEQAAPALARQVRERLDAHAHKTIATLRRDGSPRISGTETTFADGELWIGSMWQARKARDLQRDGRFALHSGSDDPPAWKGDAKLAGVAEEVTDPERVRAINGSGPPGPSHLFRLDVREASVVRLHESGKEIVVEVWTPEAGVRAMSRA
jgi:hypothetical protein